MMSVLTDNVLVLNSSWMPVDVNTVYEASKKVCRDEPRARFVDPETYVSYSLEEWVDTWDDAIRSSKFGADQALKNACMTFRIPEVIVLLNYDGDGQDSKKKRPPKFSRKNINLRDNWTCQYCGKKCRSGEYNYDHVTPKSRGGGMSWKNIVFSCIPCNSKKGGRTPEEAGMVLLREPWVPGPGDLKKPYAAKLRRKLKGGVLPSWEHFLGKMYWEVELTE
jgi:5-methylcytosine-specific restriction endonuclease McrA